MATSLLVSIATSRVWPVVVLPMVMGSAKLKNGAPLTWWTRAIAPATGAGGAVVKLQTTLAPSAVLAALVTVPATVAVKTVPAASGVVGVRVAIVPVASSVTVAGTDRKSTRLNSSHRCISYAVFCLKKKKKEKTNET